MATPSPSNERTKRKVDEHTEGPEPKKLKGLVTNGGDGDVDMGGVTEERGGKEGGEVARSISGENEDGEVTRSISGEQAEPENTVIGGAEWDFRNLAPGFEAEKSGQEVEDDGKKDGRIDRPTNELGAENATESESILVAQSEEARQGMIEGPEQQVESGGKTHVEQEKTSNAPGTETSDTSESSGGGQQSTQDVVNIGSSELASSDAASDHRAQEHEHGGVSNGSGKPNVTSKHIAEEVENNKKPTRLEQSQEKHSTRTSEGGHETTHAPVKKGDILAITYDEHQAVKDKANAMLQRKGERLEEVKSQYKELEDSYSILEEDRNQLDEKNTELEQRTYLAEKAQRKAEADLAAQKASDERQLKDFMAKMKKQKNAELKAVKAEVKASYDERFKDEKEKWEKKFQDQKQWKPEYNEEIRRLSKEAKEYKERYNKARTDKNHFEHRNENLTRSINEYVEKNVALEEEVAAKRAQRNEAQEELKAKKKRMAEYKQQLTDERDEHNKNLLKMKSDYEAALKKQKERFEFHLQNNDQHKTRVIQDRRTIKHYIAIADGQQAKLTESEAENKRLKEKIATLEGQAQQHRGVFGA